MTNGCKVCIAAIDEHQNAAGCINDRFDENKKAKHGGIGKEQESESVAWYEVNDRIVFEWQKYAGQIDPKTVDAHLSAIRDFERVTGGKPFHRIKTGDAASYRDTADRTWKNGQG